MTISAPSNSPSVALTCRHCAAPLSRTFVDLGVTPLCQRHVTPENFQVAEPTYPLRAFVCDKCKLVQLPDHVAPDEIFNEDYAYFSSFSTSWLEHARKYAVDMTGRFGLGRDSMVMEAASNDGYLLRHFAEAGIPVHGIEPSGNTAEAAEKVGVPTTVAFLGAETAAQIVGRVGKADLVAANNVIGHVPNLNDFCAGLAGLIKPTGVVTVEIPHILNLIENNQFDTIYHEHWQYYWFTTLCRVLATAGLEVFDVEELPTHGGSMRVFAGMPGQHEINAGVGEMCKREVAFGMDDPTLYAEFGEKVRETKRKLLTFLIDAKRAGKTVVGYGAPGKGNTLLNYCGIGTDFIDYTVDRSPHKQGNYLPGSRIPIHAPEMIEQTKPDYVLILPWNLKNEIAEQMSVVREWGGQFVVPIPEVSVF
ncbi:MAG: class I SAM-dependent methyltransferase [Planctomycetota bacterium]